MRQIKVSVLVVLAGLAIAACGGTSTSNAPAASSSVAASAPAGSPAGSEALACATAPVPADAAATVDVKDFKFNPDAVSAKVGEVIAWTNSDSAPHTASLADGSCSTDQLATGITGALIFNVAGSYPYQCNIHPSQMKGTITITE